MPCVVRSVVPSDLCVGCGICATICPQNILGMRFNKYGEYEAYLKQDCEKECGACYKVCPFGNDNPNEDVIGQKWFGKIPDIKHDGETGFYLASFVGYADKYRQTGASGGMVTWLLTTLLSEGEIDAVICVSPSNEADTLFKYSIMSNVKGIESSSGSAYYPVQLSDVISYVINTPGRYAITALPCFAKSIRLAQMRNKILSERMVCIIGITCGQMKSKHYTDYLAALSGVKGELVKARYRGKDRNQPASNFYFSCENTIGNKGKIFWNEGVSEAWTSRWFTLNPCNYCDDIFAECADVTCMDAWLPEYWSDWKGTNLILIRSPQLLKLVKEGIDMGELNVSLTSNNKMIQSQNGLVTFKRHDLMARLLMADKNSKRIPTKRVHFKRYISPIDVMKARLSDNIQFQSKEIFLKHQTEGELDPTLFRKEMGPYQKKMHVLQRATAITHIPTAAIKKLRRHFS